MVYLNEILNLLNLVCSGWIPEYKFLEDRKFRFDFANIELKIAIEIEGGCWVGGWHNRGSGYIKDMEKYNLATVMGWKVLRYSTRQKNEMIRDIKILIKK